MGAQIIDGKAISAQWRERAAQGAKELAPKLGRAPALAVVLVGDDPASHVYVRNKVRDTEGAGMRSIEIRLPAEISQEELEKTVDKLNADDGVDGILVQLPLPKGLNSDRVIERITPYKDVDGLTAQSAGLLLGGQPGLQPCTPFGCLILAKETLGDLTGKNCVVLGRSILVGKPAALLFLEANCTVTIAHSRTKDLPALCRTADILIPAIGRPEFVKGDWVKPGACVIDVGINRVPSLKDPSKTRLVGDVAYDEVAAVAGSITPVPGGVGPMTIACLLRNTVVAAAMRNKLPIPDAVKL